MVLTIALVVLAAVTLAALEILLFWTLGRSDDRRRRSDDRRRRSDGHAADWDQVEQAVEPACRQKASACRSAAET